MAPPLTFPVDIYNLIFSILPQKYLLECRLVNKFVGEIATTWAFRHIRLEATRGPSNFIHIVESDRFRPLVREVTLDVWTDSIFRNSHFRFWGDPIISPYLPLLRALPFLRLFKNLKTLNIRFDPEDEDYLHDHHSNFRCYLLSTVFSCLAGTWSVEWKKQLERDLRIDSHSYEGHSEQGSMFGISPPNVETNAPIGLKTLTVSHLHSFDDVRLTSSNAFKQVIESGSLRELKLLVTTELLNDLLDLDIDLDSTYNFLETLSRTWLAPSLAQNLRVLSLYCTEYWGWDPKMDFRTVNPGINSDSGFPNLKVLALGNYVFSHQWQLDWIASLGIHNSSGGLQELYLDDCPIMWYARIKGSLDTTDTICSTADGQEIIFPNAGYPQKEAMLSEDLDFHSDNSEVHFDLRWHHALSQWKDTMSSLKTFRMGHGASWDFESAGLIVRSHPEVWPVIPQPDVQYFDDYVRWHRDRRAEEQPFEGTVFLNYDCVPPPEGRDPPGSNAFRQGVGFYQRRQHVMQYVYFDFGASPKWIERDHRRRMIQDERIMEYDDARRLDEEALSGLMNAVEARRRGI